MHQSLLISQLHAIFPAEQILVNSRALSNLRDPGTYSILELDAFIPNVNLAFEFQDDYHYITTWYHQESLKTIHQKDDVKKRLARQNEITLIVIPNWWDGMAESLMETIRFHRPDTDLEFSLPIPFNPFADYFQSREMPDVAGELMQASFPPDISLVDFSNNDWWLGEKYDGVRCCWNPLQKVAYTRTGKELSLLPSVAASLSPVLLDCEIWFGRGMFALTGVLVKSFLEFVQWDLLRVIGFDTPSESYKNSPFEERYGILVANVPPDHVLVHIAARSLAKSDVHMKFFLNAILENAGEGLIARKVGSLYENGRSSSLLKIKNVTGDQEGIVVGIGKQNSVHLRLTNDAVITVPAENVLTTPPRVGDVVTFCFDSFKRRSEPENPKIIRIRTDVSWRDLAQDAVTSRFGSQVGTPLQTQVLKKMRNFMESFARRKNMDPLLAETWHNIPYESIYQFRTGRIILKKFKGYFKALRQLFPEINFNSSIVSQASSWHSIENRRKFFESYARANKFDPLNPNNWYAQPKQKFMAVKGAYRVISYHNNSFFRSLLDLFPDIGLEKSKLWLRVWGDSGSRRKFFENFAREHGFDPLIAEHWYAQSRKQILAYKGAKNVIRYHKNSVTKALTDLFPTVGLQKSKLWIKLSTKERANRRKFFENYAKANGFDPLNPEKWYSQPRKKILSVKGCKKVINFHKDSVVQALLDLFPEIGFEKSKFESRHVWNDSSLRRKIFEDYAKKYGFDPLVPENWYSQPRRRINSFKGASGTIRYYDHSISKALLDCFPQIGLKAGKFSWVLPDWREPKNRRKFFEMYAAKNGFDPLSPAHWYTQQRENIISSKGASRVISYHSGSVSKALLDLFPEIGLDKFKMGVSTWVDINNRRKFFEKYAQENGFDPLHASEWYSQPKARIMAQKGAAKVMAYHQNNVAKALADCFPDLGINPMRFLWAQSQWQDEGNRRNFFVNFAKKHSFDPLSAEKWYLQRKEDIMSRKGAFSIVNYYKCSLANALISLFPETQFVKSKFK